MDTNTKELKGLLHESIENIDDEGFLQKVKDILGQKHEAKKDIKLTPFQEKRIAKAKEYSKKLDTVFKEAVELLAYFPSLDRKLSDREEPVFVKDHYQIDYLNEEEAIKVLHLWDSRRNPDELEL